LQTELDGFNTEIINVDKFIKLVKRHGVLLSLCSYLFHKTSMSPINKNVRQIASYLTSNCSICSFCGGKKLDSKTHILSFCKKHSAICNIKLIAAALPLSCNFSLPEPKPLAIASFTVSLEKQGTFNICESFWANVDLPAALCPAIRINLFFTYYPTLNNALLYVL
jgi:hypothetical protein